MDSIAGLFYGLGIALQPQNILFCFLGCFVGTLIGVLPGLGPGGALALLLPVTFALPPATAIIMLSGIYYGAMYGGSTTSILINIPGEAASVVTCLDGYQMARKGRAGPALGMAAIASFIAGTISLFGLLFLAPPFANFALKFSSPEYVSLIICGLILVSFLGAGSKLKAFMMGTLGLLLGTIGTDPIEGIERFSFGIPYLMDGVGLIPVIMGLFGISEILINLEEEAFVGILTEKIKNLFPTLKDWKDSAWPIVRGTVLGFFIGVIPGGNTVISSTMSYALEKKISKHPEKFGTGVIEGVAGPESANNSGPSGSFIPLLSLGIPTNSTMALLLAVPDDSRHFARPLFDQSESGYFLERDCEHVHREHHAFGLKPASSGTMGSGHKDSLCLLFPHHLPFLSAGELQPRQYGLRYRGDDFFRDRGFFDEEIRL